jgi:hypothetical protein
LSSNFEPYKPDKAILQHLGNHARQLGLDPLSFANLKDKNSKSDKSERQQSSSSEKKHSKNDRFNKKRKRTDASDFKSKSKDSKSKSRDSIHDKTEQRKIPFSEQCRNPPCKQRVTNTNHRHKDCRYTDGIQPSPKHPTWVKLLLRARIINPSASHHRKRDLSRKLLPIMIADVTFVMIQIIYQMLVYRRTRTNSILRAS